MTSFPSIGLAPEERVAWLESELAVSRQNEERREMEAAELRRRLQDAMLAVARQEQELARITRDLPGGATGAIPRPDPSRAVALHANRTDAEAARVRALWSRLPAWATGTILPDDESFLGALIDRLRPERVYEIGVASGASSAFILHSLSAYADPAATWLHSYDVMERCYFNDAYRVGEAARLMVPELVEQWDLHAGATVLDVPRENESRSLYFIDADHAHPAPSLDLIVLLPRLRPGDHVVLHDINLPRLYEGKFPEHGASWLFEDWLGPRLVSGSTIPNIGAIVIPDDKDLIRASLKTTIARPWETLFPDQKEYLDTCGERLVEFLDEP